VFNQVRYWGSALEVMLGDLVTTRVFLRRRKARVVYLPGVSPKRDSLEHHGLQWVGFQEMTGPFLSALIDPATGHLDRRIQFLARGEAVPALVGDAFVESGECVDD
jgi:hypothetical protein